MKRNRTEGGFSLLEVLLSIVILGFVLWAVVLMFGGAPGESFALDPGLACMKTNDMLLKVTPNLHTKYGYDCSEFNGPMTGQPDWLGECKRETNDDRATVSYARNKKGEFIATCHCP